MAATIEVARLGVPLIAEGTKEFIKAMDDAAKAANSFAQKTGREARRGSRVFSFAMQAIATAAGMAAVEIGKTLVRAVGRLVGSVTGFVKEGAFMAGRFEEMRITALAVGRAMGWTETKILSGIRALEEGGIRTDVAAQAVAQFARNQIDLAHATDLARAAQGAAIIVGEDSSATLQRFTYAISTGNSMLLKRLMITKSFVQMEEEAAKAIGKTRDQLSQQEIMQARMNGVIKESAMLMDVYDEAMMSPTKKLRSLTGRVLPSMKAALTETLLPAWYKFVSTIYDFAQAVTEACKEGGALYPILINIGAVASLAADGFKSLIQPITDMLQPIDATGDALFRMGPLAQRGTNTVVSSVVNMAKRIIEIGSKMFAWGVEMVGNLARGIIRGVSTVLVAAMNAIGNLLTSWLSPGSAPRIAPDIGVWGMDTFNEYLKGFSLASFDLLAGIQKPLQDALSRAVGMEKIGRVEAGKIFIGISGALTEAIARFRQTGKVGERIFEQIKAAGGTLGEDIAELARRQFRLAAALETVRKAEERLEAAREERTDAETAMSTAVKEYNKLVAEGASPEILAAKKKEFDEAKERLKLAKAEEKEAESQKKIADKQVKPLQLQAEQQERLLDALSRIAEEQEKIFKAAKIPSLKGLKEEVEEIAAAMADIVPAEFDITSPLAGAIEKAKAALKEKLKGLFQPIIDEWEKTKAVWEERVGPVREKWEEFSATINQVWEEKLKPAFESLQDWLAEKVPIAMETLSDFWEQTLLPAFEDMKNWLADKIPGALETLRGFWEDTLLPALKAVWDFIENSIVPLFKVLAELVGVTLTLSLEALTGLWENVLLPVLRDDVVPALGTFQEVLDSISSAIETVIGWVKKLIEKIKKIKLPSFMVRGSRTPFELSLLGIADAMRQLSTVELPKLQLETGNLGLPAMGIGGGGGELRVLAPVFLSREEVEYGGELDWTRVMGALERRYGEKWGG